MTAPSLRPQTLLGLGASLPVDEPYNFVTETVRAIPTTIDLSGMRGTRSPLAAQLVAGPYAVSGNVLLQPSLDELAALLPRILGGIPIGGDPPGGTTCMLAETLPDFYLAVDRVAGVFIYSGCKIVHAQISAGLGEPVNLLLRIEGLAETIDAPGTFPPLDDAPAPMIRLAGARVDLLGGSREVKRVSLEIENTAILDRFVNSLTRVDLPIVDRKVRLRCWLDYTGASADLYADQGTAVSAAVEMYAAGRWLKFDFNHLRLQTASPVVNGAGELLLELESQAGAGAAGDEFVVMYAN